MFTTADLIRDAAADLMAIANDGMATNVDHVANESVRLEIRRDLLVKLIPVVSRMLANVGGDDRVDADELRIASMHCLQDFVLSDVVAALGNAGVGAYGAL